jgi:hypothetical protein
MTPK